MTGQNGYTSYMRKIHRVVVLAVMVLGLAALTADPVQARQPKPKIDNTHCACACNTWSGTDILEYPNPGACGALNGKTCNIEVNQGGAGVLRSDTLVQCGPRVIMRLQTIPNLRPIIPARTQ